MGAGGRFDSPKVWNASTSSLGFHGNINLIAEIAHPDTIATRIIEPLVILWALSIPRGMDRIYKHARNTSRAPTISKYFFAWPYYVRARIYRGNPIKGNSILTMDIPAAALRGIKTSYSSENATYRGMAITALKIEFDLEPVYNTVYGTLDLKAEETAMFTFDWFLKKKLSGLAKIKTG